MIAGRVEEEVAMSEAVPQWMRPDGGFTADDLDRLADLPRRTELIDGGLVFMSPQTRFHMRMLFILESALRGCVPKHLEVVREMSVLLGERQRPEPDLMIVSKDDDIEDSATSFAAGSVLLAVEVVSPDSVIRDRKRKPLLYAEAGIMHLWRVENDGGKAVVYVYELDPATRTYAKASIHRERLVLQVPFPLAIDLSLTDV